MWAWVLGKQTDSYPESLSNCCHTQQSVSVATGGPGRVPCVFRVGVILSGHGVASRWRAERKEIYGTWK